MEIFLKMPPPLIILGVFFSIIMLLQILKSIIKGYMNGVIGQFILVIRDNKGYFVLGLIIVISMIFMLDKPISLFCQKFYNMHFYTDVDFISSCGEGWFVFGILCLFLTIFQVFNQVNGVVLTRISLISGVYAGLLNGILKFILNRQRPSIGIDPLVFFHFFIKGGGKIGDLIYAYNSMPSGHTITVVAVITPLFMHTKNKLLKLLIAIIPVLELFSRVYTLNHWASDVTLATLLGVFVGIATYNANQIYFVKSKS